MKMGDNKTINNWWLIGIILCLLIINIILNKKEKSCQNMNRILVSNLCIQQEVAKLSTEHILNQLSLSFDNDWKFNEVVCNSFLSDGGKLLVFFSDNGCKQCLLSLVMDLNIIAKKIGRDKIILIGDFGDFNLQSEYLKGINDGYKSFIVNDVVTEWSENHEMPKLYVLKPNYEMISLISDIEGYSSEWINCYYDIIQKYFENAN